MLPVLVLVGWFALQTGRLWLMRLLLFGMGLAAYIFALFTVDSIYVMLLLPVFYISMGALLLNWRGVVLVGIGYGAALAYVCSHRDACTGACGAHG